MAATAGLVGTLLVHMCANHEAILNGTQPDGEFMTSETNCDVSSGGSWTKSRPCPVIVHSLPEASPKTGIFKLKFKLYYDRRPFVQSVLVSGPPLVLATNFSFSPRKLSSDMAVFS
jgi:hypothetical protein